MLKTTAKRVFEMYLRLVCSTNSGISVNGYRNNWSVSLRTDSTISRPFYDRTQVQHDIPNLADRGHTTSISFPQNLLSGETDSPEHFSLLNFVRIPSRRTRSIAQLHVSHCSTNYQPQSSIVRLMRIANDDPLIQCLAELSHLHYVLIAVKNP